MARFGASCLTLVCVALFAGSMPIPALAQDADEPPPVARPRPRVRVPVRPVRNEGADREAPAGDDREARDDDAETPPVRNERREQKLPRGQVQPMRLPAIDGDLLQVLKDWEFHSAQVKILYGEVERTTFEWTFLTQKHAKGSFAYRAPDQGIFRMSGLDVQIGGKGDVRTNPINRKKQQLTLAEDKEEHWICTGKELISIDHQAKTLERMVIPPQNRGQGIMETPLPFLFGMKVQQARARYEMKFLPDKKDDPNEVWLSAKPLWPADAANYKEAKVILSRKTFLPRAVLLTNPAGTAETIYQFSNFRTKLNFLEPKPFEQPLPKYKQVQTARGGDANSGPAATRTPDAKRR